MKVVNVSKMKQRPRTSCLLMQQTIQFKTRRQSFVLQATKKVNDGGDTDADFNRRDFVSSLMISTASSLLLIPLSSSNDANAIDIQKLEDEPPITHKVTFNVRISRADGTFYTRSDPDLTPDTQVFTGSLAIGLYGTLAPNHVDRFLSYANVQYSPADDAPLPSYARSQFPSLDQTSGLLTSGYIPGLRLTTFAGSSALEYGTKVLPSKLWVDDFTTSTKRIPHSRAGLLTHRDLDVLPDFGITTRSAPELNSGHTVFGTVLPTDSSKAFLSRCVDLPTYSIDRPAVAENSSRAVEEVASSVYSFQKDLFRSAAKSFGDTRLTSVYEGKLLRRVEVTSVSLEKM